MDLRTSFILLLQSAFVSKQRAAELADRFLSEHPQLLSQHGHVPAREPAQPREVPVIGFHQLCDHLASARGIDAFEAGVAAEQILLSAGPVAPRAAVPTIDTAGLTQLLLDARPELGLLEAAVGAEELVKKAQRAQTQSAAVSRLLAVL